jgi:predicted amidohydrolase YtcJ
MRAVHDLVPEPSDARKRELLKLGMKQITATGVTSVHNMNGDMEEMMTYAAMEDAGEMLLRVYVPYWVKPDATEEMLTEAAEMAKIQGWLARGGAAKFFMDGVWESYTALNIDPYADDPDATEDGIWSLERFTKIAAACDKLGLQIFVHACGDGAVRRTLDGYEAVQKLNGKRDSRHRVEHIEVIHPDDMPRFSQLDVIASMQPIHSPLTVQDADVWLTRTGPQRWPVSFAWRDLKNAGATLAFGSDWTVAPFNPMLGLYAALNRQKWEPDNPDQRLTLEETLIGYTRDAAYAEFQEHQKGQLKEGYLADIVLLSEDIFQVPPEELKDVKPLFTMMDGKMVFEA